MTHFNRRKFLQLSSLSVVPLAVPFMANATVREQSILPPADVPRVMFINDGPMYTPAEYIAKLNEINKAAAIQKDSYMEGGAVDQLLKKFMAATGKEAAIYMPTGTMANQLAIAVLSGENTKVFVQDTSHVYRDEADAAQSIYNKRLIPLGKEQAYFTLEELQQSIQYLDQNEVFKSGIGAVSIENPVRRSEGRMFPIEEIKKISAYCRTNGYKLHLDGARLYMAAAWSGISIAAYASYFDTVYISLYKYLGAGGGAILCGDKTVIGKMQHLVKVHGGTIYSNWANAAMALHHLEGFEKRLQDSIVKWRSLMIALNQLTGIQIEALNEGTNIYTITLAHNINSPKLSKALRNDHNIFLAQVNDKRRSVMMVNETLLVRDNNSIVDAFKTALKTATP